MVTDLFRNRVNLLVIATMVAKGLTSTMSNRLTNYTNPTLPMCKKFPLLVVLWVTRRLIYDIYLSINLSIYLCIYLSISLSINIIYINIPIYLFIYLSIYLSIYFSIYLSIYLSSLHYHSLNCRLTHLCILSTPYLFSTFYYRLEAVAAIVYIMNIEKHILHIDLSKTFHII